MATTYPTFDENKYPGDLIKYETPANYCRKTLTLAQDADAEDDLVVGQLLEADSTKEVVLATGASCNAILLEKVLATDLAADDVEAVCLVRGPAVIDGDNVTCDSDDKTDALAALEDLGIIALEEPSEVTEGTDET